MCKCLSSCLLAQKWGMWPVVITPAPNQGRRQNGVLKNWWTSCISKLGCRSKPQEFRVLRRTSTMKIFSSVKTFAKCSPAQAANSSHNFSHLPFLCTVQGNILRSLHEVVTDTFSQLSDAPWLAFDPLPQYFLKMTSDHRDSMTTAEKVHKYASLGA